MTLTGLVRISKVSSVLARFVRQNLRNHPLAAIGLYQGQCTSLQSDAWNEPESYNLVIPLTRVTRGDIWIEDPEGTAQCHNPDCNLPGKILELETLHRSMARAPRNESCACGLQPQGLGEANMPRLALADVAGF